MKKRLGQQDWLKLMVKPPNLGEIDAFLRDFVLAEQKLREFCEKIVAMLFIQVSISAMIVDYIIEFLLFKEFHQIMLALLLGSCYKVHQQIKCNFWRNFLKSNPEEILA